MQKLILIRLYVICTLCLLSFFSSAQKIETANQIYSANDTTLLGAYAQKILDFTEVNKDSALYYGAKAITLAKKLKQQFYEGMILTNIAYNFIISGDYTNGLKCLIEATKLSEAKDVGTNIIKTAFIENYLQKNAEANRIELQGYIKNCLGILYGFTESPEKQLQELLATKHLIENVTNDMFLLAGVTDNIVYAYMELKKFDSALYYQKQSMAYRSKSSINMYEGGALSTIGEIYLQQGKQDSAKKYLFDAIKIMAADNENIIIADAYISLAKLYHKRNQFDSGIYYANKAMAQYTLAGTAVPQMLDAYTALALNYNKNKRFDSAYKYMNLAKTMSDSLNNVHLANLGKFHSMGFEEKLRLQKLQSETIATRNRNRMISLSAAGVIFLMIAFILYRNNKTKQKANKILQATLSNLKSTQAQLIQQEKMASLGVLTAGIAHEIQNPLNFINNFSDVNKELLDEMKEAIVKGNSEEAQDIMKDVIDNLEKINHHGKRADRIVKGMLQHSRTSSGQKELTDINALCDEYLRLSYHGLRAKDKSFNAEFKTDFDNTIQKINIVPQDIGRVLLNLINNAFYAVNEKKKTADENYKPEATVQTIKLNSVIEIRISDNGNGIPQKNIDKIFQPFFTTKPTGSGTGLGLSLSYDIVKAHGGEIKVNSKEGEGTEFIIELPVA